MTANNPLQHLDFRSFFKPVLVGAGMGLLLVSFFLFVLVNALSGGTVEYGFWVLVPMTTVIIGGAGGGIFYQLLKPLQTGGRYRRVLVILIGMVAYVIALWLSLVAGLAAVGLWD